MTVEEYEGIKIIHTYKGKEVTQTFFKNNIHLFKAPNTRVLLKALEILETRENLIRDPKLSLMNSARSITIHQKNNVVFNTANHNSPKE
jgi:hypothetical protein